MPPVKSLVGSTWTETVALEVVAPVVDVVGSGSAICTSSGWNEMLDCGIVMRPFDCSVALPVPFVATPATVNVGVNTERRIATLIVPGFPTSAPALDASSGATTATTSATTAATASRRFLGPKPLDILCFTPPTSLSEPL